MLKGNESKYYLMFAIDGEGWQPKPQLYKLLLCCSNYSEGPAPVKTIAVITFPFKASQTRLLSLIIIFGENKQGVNRSILFMFDRTLQYSSHSRGTTESLHLFL